MAGFGQMARSRKRRLVLIPVLVGLAFQAAAAEVSAEDARNPLWTLLCRDFDGRQTVKAAGRARLASAFSPAEAKWARLRHGLRGRGGSGVGGYMLEGDLPADAVRRALVSGDDPPVVDPPADKPPVDAPAGDFFVRP